MDEKLRARLTKLAENLVDSCESYAETPSAEYLEAAGLTAEEAGGGDGGQTYLLKNSLQCLEILIRILKNFDIVAPPAVSAKDEDYLKKKLARL